MINLNNKVSTPIALTVIVVLAIVLVGGILWCLNKLEIFPQITTPLFQSCSSRYQNIEKEFKEANSCKENSDCKVITLGGPYVEFGCYKFVNIQTNEKMLLNKVEEYAKSCMRAIDECAPSPSAICIENKCVAQENK